MPKIELDVQTLLCTLDLHIRPGDTLLVYNESVIGVLPKDTPAVTQPIDSTRSVKFDPLTARYKTHNLTKEEELFATEWIAANPGISASAISNAAGWPIGPKRIALSVWLKREVKRGTLQKHGVNRSTTYSTTPTPGGTIQCPN